MHKEGLLAGGVMNDIVAQARAARLGGRPYLAQALSAARQRSLQLFDAWCSALGPEMRVPCTAELNLPLWELGHIGWFADWWITRNPERALGLASNPRVARLPARQQARGLDADNTYDSSAVAHHERWQRHLPDADGTRADLAASLDDILNCLERAPQDDQGLYFHRLALLHEDMHAEAAIYMAQTLGFDPYTGGARPFDLPSITAPVGRLTLPAQSCRLGRSGPGFAFDNELQAQQIRVNAFEIDARVVDWAQFLAFIDDGGYQRDEWWTPAGRAWRQAGDHQAPRYLREVGGHWQCLRFGQWQALDLAASACHLSAFEAQAWCRWAGRRLPSEAEWTVAATTRPDFVWGSVWEWTGSPFAPFPGFRPHPYADYSEPWFDGRPVLKGASPATVPRLRDPTYRNYFLPERTDIMAGFRSVLS